MIAVVQRVHEASVEVDGRCVGAIGAGLLALASIVADDGVADLRWTAARLAGLRLFPSGDKAFDLDVAQAGGALLLVSNFTVSADCRRGRRPSFDAAMPPAPARAMFDEFVRIVRATGLPVATGQFGAHMDVRLVNDGPVTVVLDSRAAR